MSLYNDTLFLEKMNVMDYSLLVGVDITNQELVVGIVGISPHTLGKVAMLTGYDRFCPNIYLG